MAKEKKEKKVKIPTAQKRNIQSEKRNQRNRRFKSRVNTAIRTLKEAVTKKEDAEVVKDKINLVYSLMDKGAKKGIFKKNKASRIKSKMKTFS